MTTGLAGCYAVADQPREVEAMVADPVATLREPHRPGGADVVAGALTARRSGPAPARGHPWPPVAPDVGRATYPERVREHRRPVTGCTPDRAARHLHDSTEESCP